MSRAQRHCDTGGSHEQTRELRIDRLFESPALAGPSILGVKISPDSKRVLYLRGREEEKDRLDLWAFDIGTQHARLLIDATALAPTTELSDEERARRERQRTGALSGILEYFISPSTGAILVPLDGRLYHLDLADDTSSGGSTLATRVTKIGPSSGAATDATFSPRGSLVAFVCDQNLHMTDLTLCESRRLTTDGGGPIKNGMSEFVAQEEMNRHTGYWWSPHGSHIAFARVDESRVSLKDRFEIAADGIAAHSQRYPAAGQLNVSIQLGVVAIASGHTVWMDLGDDPDFYLARVGWLPGGRSLAVQIQSRDQRRLDLRFFNIETGSGRAILTETSDTWVEPHDELSFLSSSDEFIWASSRDGHRHLYLYDIRGQRLRQLTAGEWDVDDLRGRALKSIDEKGRWIYFTATAKDPTERHLYRCPLDPGPTGNVDPPTPQRISHEEGLHSVKMAPGTDFYVDLFASETQPPRLDLRSLDGRLLSPIVDNRIGSSHPYAAYVYDDSLPEFGRLAADDGQPLCYRLFKPAHFDASARYPAIVDVYGGPGVQRVLRGWCGGSFTQILTRAGYVVFQLDNRGSAHRGTTFEAPIQGRLGQIEVADQLLGVNWLRSLSFVDPERIGVWGWSYGGYLALMLMCKGSGTFRAGVSGAPVTDWTLYDTHYTERYLGIPGKNALGYEQSAIAPQAAGLQGALLVMHGMADDNVLFLHATKLFRVLQDLGKSFDVMVYPGAKHGLLRQPEGKHAYAMIQRFLDASLRR